MMRKLIAVLTAAILMCVSLAGCGNENWGLGNYTFTHAHISLGDVGHCVTVDSWHDNELGCEIHTSNGGIYLSEGTYQLFEKAETCPYCGG
jgi:predicted small secreted protein